MSYDNVFKKEAFLRGFETGLEKDAFVGSLFRGLGKARRGLSNIAKSTAGTVKSTARLGLGKAQAIQRGTKAHIRGAKRYLGKNYQAGLKGGKGVGYNQAVRTEKGMITRKANQQAKQKVRAQRLQQASQAKAQRKSMKRRGTQQAATRAEKPLPNQKAKMTQVVNQRVNQRAVPGIQPKGPVQSKINKIKNAPLSAKTAPQNNILQKGKQMWNNLTDTQKNLAKGTAVGAGVVGGASTLRGSDNNQSQGYYR